MKKLDYYEIGQRIKAQRKNLLLSQEEAAELCGISLSFYSNIERGVKIMSLETFASICEAFKMSPDYLLNDSIPNSDEVVLNTLSEAKKFGSIQYAKYLNVIKALAKVADEL